MCLKLCRDKGELATRITEETFTAENKGAKTASGYLSHRVGEAEAIGPPGSRGKEKSLLVWRRENRECVLEQTSSQLPFYSV